MVRDRQAVPQSGNPEAALHWRLVRTKNIIFISQKHLSDLLHAYELYVTQIKKIFRMESHYLLMCNIA